MSDYIPPELIPNILARLPVDDVLRCTSVCKSWYSLITSPSFASSHLILSSPNQEPRLLISYLKYRLSYCLHRDNQMLDEIVELDVPVSFWGSEWEIIDSLNGLFCLYDTVGCGIVLWNPSLRKSLILPDSRVLSDSQVTYHQTIGFGFVATSNDYKIVKFSYTHITEPQAEIYELSTGSWRDLKPGYFLDVNVTFQQAHLNGILHWYACNPRKVNPICSSFICSFDLKSEKFGTLMVPSCLHHDDVYCIPFTFRESLCSIDETSDGFCKIWVMKEYGVADSWEELFNINTQHHDLGRFLYFRDNGEILFEISSRSYGKQKLVSYDYKNDRVKNDGLPANCGFTCVHTYAENLVLI